MTQRRPSHGGAALALALVSGLLLAPVAQARSVVLKIGTAAPRGTPWAKAAEEMGEAFARLSDGQVQVRVYAGVVGDEPTILRKLRVGQLHGAVLTSTGLSLIAREPMALQLPMVFASYAELDAVRAVLEPELAAALAAQGFVVLNWGDAGWLYFFTKKPAASLEDIAGIKSWMWAHDSHGVKAFKQLGLTPVVLSSVDLVPSLQTGMIEAFPATPMVALSMQAYSLAPHLVDVPWAPVIGATVLDKTTWERLPEALRPSLQQAAAEVGARLRAEVRSQTGEALALMEKNGLQRHSPTPAQLAAWQAKAAELAASTRGSSLDAALVDRVIELRDQARRSKQP